MLFETVKAEERTQPVMQCWECGARAKIEEIDWRENLYYASYQCSGCYIWYDLEISADDNGECETHISSQQDGDSDSRHWMEARGEPYFWMPEDGWTFPEFDFEKEN